jgi:arylsulfatase A-like enzyme
MERHRTQPFFIYLAHTYPHGPLVPNPKFRGQSQAGKYGDVIAELDWSTGVILDQLSELGLAENTLVIFTSDNGAIPPFVDRYDSSGPLTGSKYTTWEGGHREPFIAYWPGRIPPDRISDSLVTAMDLLPTIVQLAGAELPENKIDGVNIWPLLSGESESTPRELVLFYNNDHLQAVRWQQWKLHLPRTKEMVPWWQGKDRGIQELDSPILIDLENDPAEEINVADAHPSIVEKLLDYAEQARVTLGDYQRRGSEQRPTGDSRTL